MFPLIRTQIIQIFQSRCNNLILQFMIVLRSEFAEMLWVCSSITQCSHGYTTQNRAYFREKIFICSYDPTPIFDLRLRLWNPRFCGPILTGISRRNVTSTLMRMSSIWRNHSILWTITKTEIWSLDSVTITIFTTPLWAYSIPRK